MVCWSFFPYLVCPSQEYNQSCKEAVNNLWQDPLKTLRVLEQAMLFFLSHKTKGESSDISDDLKYTPQSTFTEKDHLRCSFLQFRKCIISFPCFIYVHLHHPVVGHKISRRIYEIVGKIADYKSLMCFGHGTLFSVLIKRADQLQLLFQIF